MGAFDQSLKYLLHHEPADFIRFALGDPRVTVVSALPSSIPAQGRDVDGVYLIARGNNRVVVHIEFHRRHQSLPELGTDVAEAQIRLFRREGLPVLSQIWDLYGRPNESFVEARTLRYGVISTGLDPLALPDEEAAAPSAGSQCVYQRVNLRALGGDELLARGPPALWPLVALTRDGTGEAMIQKAHDAIEGRAILTSVERADHLAVLWFVAEAEDVPVRVMRAYISEERLMESTLWQSAFAKGEAKGEARGEARGKAELYVETILRILAHRTGTVDPTVTERVRAISSLEMLRAWHEQALLVIDAEGARQLAEKIQSAPLP
ncbi:MAG: hypothetical protein ABJE95_04455 [Byssovorax sp.]